MLLKRDPQKLLKISFTSVKRYSKFFPQILVPQTLLKIGFMSATRNRPKNITQN